MLGLKGLGAVVMWQIVMKDNRLIRIVYIDVIMPTLEHSLDLVWYQIKC